MKKEEIAKLSALARIELQADEAEKLSTEISAVLDYVAVVQDIADDGDDDSTKALGARFNVFRTDEATNQPDEYTQDILAEMPKTQGRYLEVPKILKTDNK